MCKNTNNLAFATVYKNGSGRCLSWGKHFAEKASPDPERDESHRYAVCYLNVLVFGLEYTRISEYDRNIIHRITNAYAKLSEFHKQNSLIL